ncbi:MAG: hypothetical protein HYX27_01100 [Acidobacteria bacterium]|nr:hypothetical protein [Acidobacteriota bacterium]
MHWVYRVSILLTLSWTALCQGPAVADGGVLNAATFATGQAVTPGSLVSIFGSNLAAGLAQADSIPLSTSLANVSVTFNNVPAPLLFVSPGQINAQIPWNTLPAGTLTGTANVVVTRNGVASAPKPVSLAPFSPGIYAVRNLAIAINPDGTLAQPVGAIQGINCRPAKAGDYVIILGSGLGALDSEVANGRNSTDKLRNVVTPPQVLVNGMSAQLLFAGISPDFVGVYQVNAFVPAAAGAGSAHPLQWQVSGIASPNTTTMAVTL